MRGRSRSAKSREILVSMVAVTRSPKEKRSLAQASDCIKRSNLLVVAAVHNHQVIAYAVERISIAPCESSSHQSCRRRPDRVYRTRGIEVSAGVFTSRWSRVSLSSSGPSFKDAGSCLDLRISAPKCRTKHSGAQLTSCGSQMQGSSIWDQPVANSHMCAHIRRPHFPWCHGKWQSVNLALERRGPRPSGRCAHGVSDQVQPQGWQAFFDFRARNHFGQRLNFVNLPSKAQDER